MSESIQSLALLRQRIAAMENPHPAESSDTMAFGHSDIDACLHGGLARGELHEICTEDSADAGAATGFTSMLAQRLVPKGASVVWLREATAERDGSLYAPGLIELGLDPARLVIGVLPDAVSLLRAAAEVVRCAEVGVAVIELWRQPRGLDLTATRRLSMAAQASGVTALLLRIAAIDMPSAAQTRWRLRSVAAQPLEADAPGHPAFEVELARQRGGRAGGQWILEWNRDHGIFCNQVGEHAGRGQRRAQESARSGAALPRSMVPIAPGEPPGARRRAV